MRPTIFPPTASLRIAIPARCWSRSAFQADEIVFTPHLLPIPRGILSTIYVHFTKAQTHESVARVYREFFAGSPMVRLYEKALPQIQYSVRTNYADIGFQLDAERQARRHRQLPRQSAERRCRPGGAESERHAGLARIGGSRMKLAAEGLE